MSAGAAADPRDRPGAPADLHGVPRVPTWHVPRSRVDARLSADAPLTLVRGPAGSGKTMLLADWVRREAAGHRAVVWLDVSGTPSADRLWHRLVTGLVRAGALGDVDPASTAVIEAGKDVRAAMVEVLAGLTGPALVVVDGWEAVASERTEADLVHVLRRTADLHVAVAARGGLQRLRGLAELAVDVVEVGPAELRLAADEVAEVLRRAGLDDADADRVRRATDGIAVAVRAVVIAAGRGTVDLAVAGEAELTDVAVRGVAGSIDSGPPDRGYLRALRRMSVAEYVTPSLAERLVGGPADDVLRALEADGLGAWRDGDPPVFELTPVLRRALRADLDATEPGVDDELLRVVVEWGLAERHLYTALQAAAETRDLDLVTSTVMRIWGSGQARDAMETIRRLETLPRAAVARRPQLALLMALLYNTRAEHRVRALEWFALAVAATAYHLPRASRQERAVLRAGESVALRLMGRGDRAASAAASALEVLEATEPGQDAAVDALHGVLHRQLGVSLLSAGRIEAGLRAIERGAAQEASGSLGAFHVRSLVAGFTAVQGEVAAARDAVAAADPAEPPRRPETAYRRSTLDLARIHLALEDGDLDRADALLSELATELRTNEFWPAFAEVQALLDLRRGRAVAGEELLVQSMRRGRRAPVTAYWRARLTAARSLLALAGGHAERGLSLADGAPARVPAVRLARARMQLSTGGSAAAVALLAAPDLPDEGSRSRSGRRLLLAAASVADGRPAVAAAALREAAAVAEAAGLAPGTLLLAAAERRALADLAAGLDDPSVGAWLHRGDALPLVVPDRLDTVGLSEREAVVLQRLAGDQDLAEVARDLHVSHNTVKTQVRSVYRKLGVRTRADAVARARELGLL